MVGRCDPPRLFGEDHPQAKLTEAEVVEIRASTLPERTLAEKFKCNRANIGYVRRGQTWRHVL
jgi:hypothetical protein